LYEPRTFFKKYLSYLGTFRGPPVEKPGLMHSLFLLVFLDHTTTSGQDLADFH